MCNFFQKQRTDTAGLLAVQLEKLIIISWVVSLLPLAVNISQNINANIAFAFIPTLLHWIMLACGFKGALKRRAWQLAIYNVLALIAVFFVTFGFTYTLYTQLHYLIAKHHELTAGRFSFLLGYGLYFLVWMVLTILSIIIATQVILLLKYQKSLAHISPKEIEEAYPLEEMPTPSAPAQDTTAAQPVAQPDQQTQYVFYYPLMVPQDNGKAPIVFNGPNTGYSPFVNM